MIKRLSFKKQFIWNFIFIIVCSLTLSILTYSLFFILIDIGAILPSNYYEQKVPDIINYVEEKSELLLNKTEKKNLENKIPLEGIEYAVLDDSLSYIYGTFKNVNIENKDIIYDNNEKVFYGQNVIRYIPIKKESSIKGVVILSYKLTPTARNPKYNFLISNEFLLILSPFIYIIFFTWLFSRQFSKNINKPINNLITASEKIREQNLNFTIDYDEPNELGELCQSFENMKNELSISLNRQWNIEQERKDMISAIAHDLRTPLTIIKGHIEVLQESNLNNKERLKQYLNTIEENTLRAINLIKDMNSVSEVDNIDFELSPSLTNVIEFIDKKIIDYKSLLNKKHIDFNVSVEDMRKNNDFMNIDSYRISQILDNIIFNSFRFTPEYGTISLRIYIQNKKITFHIKDNGFGFSSADLKNVFKKFYCGDSTRSKEKGHSGLGLYISKCLIEKHKGHISVQNNEEDGAYVKFYINEL
ncbi:His kinase A [Gottschalkia purinilytica]|uniref:histidine kinase n=1 Tax=Gottschalkia purinilytica TaxID=1503 RepID=A0A0L0WD45_GOTPU|nr:HAMP domain-containing sensor histidine kinase [Gottschalkia purinilytica]KNF09393.1 His kinase A [Gottschalkia purinilytica]